MSGKTARFMHKRPLGRARATRRPTLPAMLFWDFRYEAIDWVREYGTVIERVMERGTEEEWLEVIRFYGLEKVIHTLKYESTYLRDHTISKVCEYFKLGREELRCYIRKQSRGGHWI